MSGQHNITVGPIAPENNPPINPQYYQPRVYEIMSITLGALTRVVTTLPHDYVIGQNVRLLIPEPYGAQELNGEQGYVVAIPSANSLVVAINSMGGNPFIPTPTFGPTPPQIIAIGDINFGLISSTGRSLPATDIPGSFINISPAHG
jgi:hypothetical protein